MMGPGMVQIELEASPRLSRHFFCGGELDGGTLGISFDDGGWIRGVLTRSL